MRLSDSNGYCQARIVRGYSVMATRICLRIAHWTIKTPVGCRASFCVKNYIAELKEYLNVLRMQRPFQ